MPLSGPRTYGWTCDRATLPTVRLDLSDEQWNAVEEGEVTAPNGTVYGRRTTRMKRKDADSLVASGCPVVTYWPGGIPEMTRVVWPIPSARPLFCPSYRPPQLARRSDDMRARLAPVSVDDVQPIANAAWARRACHVP